MRILSQPLLLAAVVTLTAFAGCLAEEPVVEEPPLLELPPPPVDNRTLTMHATGCTQYSGGIVAPADGWDAYVPPGFGMVRDQQAGQTVQLALIANVCDAPVAENGTATNATGTFALVALVVSPSEEYIDYNYSRNLAPVRLIVQEEAFAERFQEWGLDMTEVGTVAQGTTALPAGAQGTLSFSGAGTYTSDAVLGPVGDTFNRNNYRLWIHDGSNITANLLVDNMPGPRIGQGAHVWQSSGDDVLPAQSTGTMTVGSGIEAYYRWVEGGLGNPGRIDDAAATGNTTATR